MRTALAHRDSNWRGSAAHFVQEMPALSRQEVGKTWSVAPPSSVVCTVAILFFLVSEDLK